MSCIRMEFLVTPGRIMIDIKKAKKVRRKDASRADYVLFYKDIITWFSLAVIESKSNSHSPFGGMPQAIRYTKTMKFLLRSHPMETALFSIICR